MKSFDTTSGSVVRSKTEDEWIASLSLAQQAELEALLKLAEANEDPSFWEERLAKLKKIAEQVEDTELAALSKDTQTLYDDPAFAGLTGQDSFVSPFIEGAEYMVAQLGGGVGGVIGGGAGGAAGAAGATSAAGAAGAAGAAAAGAASAVATTTVATASAVATVGRVGAVVGGVALAGAAAGGGSGGSPDPAPDPLPPANPYPDTGGGEDSPELNVGASANGTTTDVNRLELAAGQPSAVHNKSLVIDLGATYGSLDGTLYHTQDVDGVLTTHVVSYRNINDVTGTLVNDQITGHAGANVLDGGAGDDIIYGAGGLDSLRGGDGEDWVLFNPLTRSSGSGPHDSTGVEVVLSGTNGALADVTGIYKHIGGEYAEASGFEHVVGSEAADRITGNDQNNTLSGAGGDDWIEGGAGDDHLFGGASSVAGDGNQLSGDAGADTFWVGYEINPVTRSIDASLDATTETQSDPEAFDLNLNESGISVVSNSSVIHDWSVGTDVLNVSYSADAVIGGVSGMALTESNTHWDGADVVDLRTNVDNQGLIQVAMGSDDNNIYLSTGADKVWTGYEYIVDNNGVIDGGANPGASAAATDIIWGWDGLTSARDSLEVAAGSTAVIGLLRGQTDWVAGDTVDLRTGVNNAGTVIVSAGAGSNIVYGSAGADYIYGSAGAGETNQVWGGAGADQFNVGISREAVSGSLTTIEVSRDLIWDWQQGTDLITTGSNGIAVIAGQMSSADWSGENTVSLASNVTNYGTIVIALGNGNDTFTGSSGKDHVYGGIGTNLIAGGDGVDHFYVGFNYDAVADTRSELGPADDAIDVIQDWQDADDLTVGTRGQAIIGGLYVPSGTFVWDGDDSINVSHATNNGIIKTAAGAGNNNITASTGVDQIYVGSQFNGGSSLSTPEGLNADDVIYGWDDQSDNRDELAVAAGSEAYIGALLDQTNWDNRSSWNAGTGWAGADTVDLRQQVNNSGIIHIAAGAGANTLYGSAGSDHFHVGYTNDSVGDQNLSSAAIDLIYGWDSRAWSKDPLTAGDWNVIPNTNWNGQSASDPTYDRLTVAAGSIARIGSLLGDEATDANRWDGVEIVDLRSSVANNNFIAADGGGIEIWTGADNDYIFGSEGRDYIYAGPGLDNLWGGNGNDVFYVGYSPSWAPLGADSAEPRIWDWQNTNTSSTASGTSATAGSSSNPGDGLRIADGSFAIIQGLWGMDPTNTGRWSGNDIVDLRWDVVNGGKIIVESSTGDDVIYGSNGSDFINPGSGRNYIHFDDSNAYVGTDGNDRVYLDSFRGETQITGFDSDDRIYLDTRMLEAFKSAKGIRTVGGFDLFTVDDISNVSLNDIGNGQEEHPGDRYNGSLFPLSKIVFESTLNGELGNYSESPRDPSGAPGYGWSSNGAYNNEAYSSTWPLAVTAVSATGYGFFALGMGLMPIPFVGPALAIPNLVIAGLMAADAGQSQHHINATYPGKLDAGVSILNSDSSPSSDEYWNDVSFLNFYNVARSERYSPSLEITGQQPTPSSDPSEFLDDADSTALYGIASYVAVHRRPDAGDSNDEGETFIYLVASRDGLVQNNETILIAQVNGLLTSDQLAMYNGGTDAEYLRYFNNAVEAPIFPPTPVFDALAIADQTDGQDRVLYRVSYTDSDGQLISEYVAQDGYVSRYEELLALTDSEDEGAITGLSFQGAYTNEDAISVTVNFVDKDGNDVNLSSNGQTDTVSFTLDGLAIEPTDYTNNGSSITAVFDINDPILGGAAAAELADGAHVLKVLVNNGDFESQGSVGFVKDTTAPEATVVETETEVFISSSEQGVANFTESSSKLLNDTNGNQVNFDVPSTTGIYTMSVQDIFGATTGLGNLQVGSGTFSSSERFVYGSAGTDVITATYDAGVTNPGASLYGKGGNDTLVGNSRNNTFVGGAGSDIYDLNGGNNTLIWNVDVGGSSSDSSTGALDYVYDFNAANDALVVVASNVSNLNASSAVSLVSLTPNNPRIIADPLNGGNGTFTQIKVELGATDLVVEFQGSRSASDISNALRVDITGTDGANNLIGSIFADTFDGAGGDDILEGGRGADQLTGGAGQDTFVFAAGDSIASVTSETSDGQTTNVVDVTYDTISLIGLADLGDDKDALDLVGTPTIASTNDIGTTSDSGVIKSHLVTDGLITFDDQDTYAEALGGSSFQLWEAIEYLQANFSNAESAVVFQHQTDSYLFQDNGADGNDLFVQLSNVSVEGLTTSDATSTANYLYIV